MRLCNKSHWQILFNLPYSLYFNFTVLPWRQAMKLPILFMIRPTFLAKLKKGSVEIHGPIRTGMIRLGITIAPVFPRKFFRWENFGKIVFNGSCLIADNSFISCGCDGELIFGASGSFNFHTLIIAYRKIEFKDKFRGSWNCTFVDTDFHPLIDVVSGRKCKMSMPIQIGNGVWVGHDCIISKGVKLADNITVSSGSVVKGVFKDPNGIIGGNPAGLIDSGFIRDDI